MSVEGTSTFSHVPKKDSSGHALYPAPGAPGNVSTVNSMEGAKDTYNSLLGGLTGDKQIDALLVAGVASSFVPVVGGQISSALETAAHMRETIQYHKQALALRSQMMTDRQKQFVQQMDVQSGRLNFMESEAKLRDVKTGQDTTLGQLRIAELEQKLSQSQGGSAYRFGPSGRGSVSDWQEWAKSFNGQ